MLGAVGSALRSGRRGRPFESGHPDHNNGQQKSSEELFLRSFFICLDALDCLDFLVILDTLDFLVVPYFLVNLNPVFIPS